MNTTTFHKMGASPRAPLAARIVLGLLDGLQHGTLHLQMPGGAQKRFGQGEPHATLVLHDWSLGGAVLARGDIGLAESFLAGGWSSPDVAALLKLLLRNRDRLDRALYGNWLGSLAARVRHHLRRNTRRGSKSNIEAHYDLGNAFYKLWLDETMNYSSAWFEQPGMTLAQAQVAKVRRALSAVGTAHGTRLLEIGCGWGALAEEAANAGASVTGVTLSHEQLAYARERLGERADLRLQDYRDIADAPFDAICSIEMVEAVGREYWPDYFSGVARLLKPGGLACIQTITIADGLWERYARGTDFIQQYIFPGGFLPCPREFTKAANAAGLEVVEAFSFGQDYARTLRLWRDAFSAQRAAVLDLGFDTRFLRLWEFYLCYCEAAFSEGNTDVVQYTLRKP